MTNRILKKFASPMALLVGALALNACSEGDVASPMTNDTDLRPAFTHGSGTHPRVEPVFYAGNIEGEAAAVCMDSRVNTAGGAWSGFKVNSDAGTTSNGITTTITDGKYLAWATGTKYVRAVVMKGGPNTNVYRYPAVHPDDSLLQSPEHNGSVPGLSHYVVCFTDPPTVPALPLTVSKTATAQYTHTHDWTLVKDVRASSSDGWVKSVSFVGSPGQSFTPDWRVIATKTVDVISARNVTGTITIGNPNPFAAQAVITDVLRNASNVSVGATVQLKCGAETVWSNSPAVRTIPAKVGATNGSLICAYQALGLPDVTATNNYVTVVKDPAWTLPVGYTGSIDATPFTQPFTWSVNNVGTPQPFLRDDRASFTNVGGFNYFTSPGRQISGSITLSPVPETFTCPTLDAHDYTTNYTSQAKNLATLSTSPQKRDSAYVNLMCSVQWKGESATGKGSAWPGQNTWFEWNAFSTSVPLVYGRNLTPIGTISMVDNGATVTINIALNAGARLKAGSGTVKVHPMDSAPTQRNHYVQPGAYTYKGSSLTGIVVSKKDFYAIHLDIEIMQ
jgi:hypothetical protein